MSDAKTTLLELRQLVAEFVDERDWRQFHTPKNLAMALAVEVGELLEHFQWLTPDQAALAALDTTARLEIADEMADVAAYLLALANALEVDLTTALTGKMVRNRAKYPVERFRGRFGPRDPRPPAAGAE